MYENMISTPTTMQARPVATGGRRSPDQFHPPQRTLRSARQSDARVNATAFLGPGGMQSDPTVDPREAGVAGAAVASVAGILKHAQTLSSLVPGSVPPPIAAWIENLMRTIPQIVSRQQAPDTSMLSPSPNAQTQMGAEASSQGSMPMQPRAPMPQGQGAYVM